MGRTIAELLSNSGIVRNRIKIQAAVSNAQVFLGIQQEFGCFDRYIWQFVKGVPVQNHWAAPQDVPATTTESDLMSLDLKRRRSKFVGSTICYALIQAVGMVNDRTIQYFRHHELRK